MPKAKKTETATQVYDIGNGATVTITFDKARRPKMRHDDTVVIVGEHACGGASVFTAPPSAEPETGPSRGEIIAWQEKREGAAKKKPFNSEDAAREAGFDPRAISFEAVAAQAEVLPSAESIVE